MWDDLDEVSFAGDLFPVSVVLSSSRYDTRRFANFRMRV